MKIVITATVEVNTTADADIATDTIEAILGVNYPVNQISWDYAGRGENY